MYAASFLIDTLGGPALVSQDVGEGSGRRTLLLIYSNSESDLVWTSGGALDETKITFIPRIGGTLRGV
jgi:hypothetical protein